MATKYLGIIALLFITTSQLGEAYPNPDNPEGRYPSQYGYKSYQSPQAQQARNTFANTNGRWHPSRAPARYYNVYNKQKLQAAETALILDHIVEVNAISKAPATTPTPTVNPDTLSCLEAPQNREMVTSMSQVSTFDGTLLRKILGNEPDTVIMTGDTNAIFRNSYCQAAILEFFQYFTTRGMPPPTHIWMNLSPPPLCLRSIMQYYQSDYSSLYIHIADMSVGKFSTTIEVLRCLTVKVHGGLHVLPWDWATFRNGVQLTDHCDKIVEDSLDDFKLKQNEVEAAMVFANEIKQVPTNILNSWCPGSGNNM